MSNIKKIKNKTRLYKSAKRRITAISWGNRMIAMTGVTRIIHLSLKTNQKAITGKSSKNRVHKKRVNTIVKPSLI